MSLTLAQMNLAPVAHEAAARLLAIHPDVVFTSGRRDTDGQARAMVGNVVLDRHWIRKTYVATPESDALQMAVNRLPHEATRNDLFNALAFAMVGWTDEQKARLSKHFSGQAWDVQPLIDRRGAITARGNQIIATIRQLPGLTKFLDREGGLARWHAQF